MNLRELEERRLVMDSSPACDVLWDMEGQALDLNHCLMEMRSAIAEHELDHAAHIAKEVRDRCRVLLAECKRLDGALAVDQLLSKCPD